jgi:hypothetical protein
MNPSPFASGIRQSHMSLAHACMRRLWFYLYRGPAPGNYFKLAGSSGHQAIEHALRTKMEEKPVNLPDVQDVFTTNYDQGLQNCEKSNEDPRKIREIVVRDVLPLFIHEEVPVIHPKLIEEPFTLEVKGIDVPLIGTIDLFEHGGRLRDFKFRFKGRASSQREVNRSFQFATYELAVEARGETVKEVTQTNLVGDVENKHRPAIKNIRQEGTELNPESVLDEYAGIVRFVDKAEGDPELYPMTSPENWWCDKKWCGWADRCPRFGGNHE